MSNLTPQKSLKTLINRIVVTRPGVVLAFIGASVLQVSAQDALDLDALLAEAEAVESPLARPFVCSSDAAIDPPETQSNGIVEVSIRRVCLASDQSRNADTVIIVEGKLYNPNSDESLDVLPAHRLFQLQGGDAIVAADQQFEAENLPDFSRGLAPFSGRDFAVSFTLNATSRDWVFVHPAQAGQLRFPVAIDGKLVTGTDLPGVLRASPATSPPAPTPATETSSLPKTTSDGPAPEPPGVQAEAGETFACYALSQGCVDLAPTAFADEIPHWFEKSEFTGAPNDLLGPPEAGAGMILGCGGNVVAIFNRVLAVDGSGADLQIFSDSEIGPEITVQVARTAGRWFDAQPTETQGGFDISALPDADVGFDLVRLQNSATGCKDPTMGPRINGVAALSGRPWTRVERRDGYSDLLGLPISRSILGGQITRLDQPPEDNVDPIFLDWTADVLNDANTYFSFRTHAENLEKPSSFAVTFADGSTAQIAALRLHSEISTGFTYHPGQIAIYASQDGPNGPWEQIGLTLPANASVAAEEFKFASPITANALRVDIFPRESSISYRGEINQSIHEIEVVEIEESDTYSSILNTVKANVLDPKLDGHLVSFTSQFDENLLSASSVLSNPVETFWQAETDQLPQELVFAFRGHDLQTIDRITMSMIAEVAFPENWAPRVRAEVSSDVSPLKGFHPVGDMSADPATGTLALDLADPTSVRYLKLVIADPNISPFGITQITARGKLSRALGAKAVFQREPTHEDINSDTEVEPDNDEASSATLLKPNTPVRGRPNSKDDVDNYRIVIDGPDLSAVTLRLVGLPRVKVNVSLSDDSGQLIASTPAPGTATEQVYTWLLAPGTYTVSLRQDSATLALFVDNSGSLGPAIFDALDAAEGFVAGKTPDEKISLFSFNHKAIRLVERTQDRARLTTAIEAWRNDPEAGKGNGTTVYDSIMDGVFDLGDVSGNKAVVMFTDGSDATSKLSPSQFWADIAAIDAPVFIVGYGSDMDVFYSEIGSKAGDAMRSIGLATEGGFYPAPTPAELPGVFAQIADRIRDLDGYEISYDVSAGSGELEILEAGGQMVSSGVLGNAIVILDASGSMKARTDAGRQRINVARSVLFDLLEQVPEEVPMGVWLYGHSLAPQPKADSCRDVALLVPPAPSNRDQIKDVAKAIAPKGQTPIGYALSRAGEMFSDDQSGLVILLTDGEETCDAASDAPYNPDRVVQSLIDRGVDLRVNIVGFDVDDPKIQAELASVAGRTGGNFFYGEGQEGLRDAMTSAFTAPIDVLDDTGRVVATGLVGDGPITLPEGSYRVRISGTDFISDRQSVEGGRAKRLYLSQEASAVRVRADSVEIGAPYADQASAGDGQGQASAPTFNPDARVPETMEELIFKTQDLLAKLGYDPGPLDGAMGGKTRRAAQSFLEANGPLKAGEPFDQKSNPTLFLWFELFAAFAESQR